MFWLFIKNNWRCLSLQLLADANLGDIACSHVKLV